MAAKLGAQMYTLREHCKTPAEIAKSCERVKKMGYDGIQASAGGFNDIDPTELRKILDDHGLECAATHKSLDALRDTEAVVDWHQKVGCELTALGSFKGTTKSEWQAFARDFNQIGKTLHQRGLRVGYHNHSHEFAPFADDPKEYDPSDAPLPLLLKELDPALWFEIDTYWVAHAGADPAQWIRKCKGRLPAIHVKDMTITAEREQKMCEVGLGNLNWPAIWEACRDADVQWYLVERDRGDLDPFESLKISLEHLREALDS